MLTLRGEGLTTADVMAVARRGERVRLDPGARTAMERSRKLVEDVGRSGKLAYGIRTGLGKLATVAIPDEDIRRMQVNILRSHAAGVGEPLPEDLARALVLIRANGLAKGYSGVRPVLVEALVALLNNDITPVIPTHGSVGTSGDLQPLAHLGLVLIGEGEAVVGGQSLGGKEALARAALKPLNLGAKEALALINGTSLTAAYAALLAEDAAALLTDSVLAASMTFEALRGSPKPFDPRISQVRPYRGQRRVAEALRALLKGSEVIPSHADERLDPRVQDPYTLRCLPQVLGSIADVVDHVRAVAAVDINAATDNPLVFPGGDSLSGGNFHGQPLAMALDYLGLAMTVLGAFSERRIARLMDGNLSGLPPFLTEHGGLNSGLMLVQYSAAALASWNKVLAHPSSADSIPTSANQEDYVAMGPTAGWKGRLILDNARRIVAMEYLCAAQGLEFVRPLAPGLGPRAAWRALRRVVPKLEEDRPPSPDIGAVEGLLRRGILVAAAEAATRPLGLASSATTGPGQSGRRHPPRPPRDR